MLRPFVIGGSAILGLRAVHAESYKRESYKPETINRPKDEYDMHNEPIVEESYDNDYPGPRIDPTVILRLVGGILIGVGHTLIAMADHIDKKD